jgi:endonuclease YncB( thermonuclease family)
MSKFEKVIILALGLLCLSLVGNIFGSPKSQATAPAVSVKSSPPISQPATAAPTAAAAQSVPIDPADVRVLDGDTIAVFNKQPNVRLVGFNAPEIDGAACPAERELGIEAKARLLALVRAGNLTFEYVRCSCPAGTHGTPACNYGRDCGTLKSNGRDVGDILIDKRLAVPFKCHATGCPTTPRPWCDAVPPPAVPLVVPPPAQTCLIKGNINSKNEKIYHVPGQRYYAQTVIDPAKGERMFCTEQEAIAAGWRKSRV